MESLWRRSRAVVNGELYAKAHDEILDTVNYTNLLVPFSPRMSPEHYRWYVSEAELPGLVSQYAKILAGGLLRKKPQLELPASVPADAEDWLRNRFTEDGRSLFAFLDAAIWEELVTSRGWVSIDFPVVEDYVGLSSQDRDQLFPYPVLWRAEDVINWQTTRDPVTSKVRLSRVVFRYLVKDYDPAVSVFHPVLKVVAADHYLDESGNYTVDTYHRVGTTVADVQSGTLQIPGSVSGSDAWQLVSQSQPVMGGQLVNYLPIYPLSGEVSLEIPFLTPVIDREVALYNKLSRRNHLMYGASTFTPVVFSDMSNEDFQGIVSAGLGTWIKLNREDKIDSVATPTAALSDMERSIESAVADMMRMGLRLLSPESGHGSGADSGIALEIRNSSVTSQLAVINMKVSTTMKYVIETMLRWKYGTELDMTDLDFKLSSDFNPAPLGAEWARLATEWYQNRLIPRSVWLAIAKQHDIIPSDYSDDDGVAEIQQDALLPANERVSIQENQ
jgi:hypothetical protein